MKMATCGQNSQDISRSFRVHLSLQESNGIQKGHDRAKSHLLAVSFSRRISKSPAAPENDLVPSEWHH